MDAKIADAVGSIHREPGDIPGLSPRISLLKLSRPRATINGDKATTGSLMKRA